MSQLNVIISKLSNIHISHRSISITTQLYGEPLKKKKRIDPILLKRRTERQMKKLEKEIYRLQRTPKQLKPIVELQLSPHVLKEIDARTRKETDNNARIELKKLLKLWNIYRCEQSNLELMSIKRMVEAQKKALKHLQMHSIELYNDAISIDPNLAPHVIDVPKKDTPPIDGYTPPDGKRTDVTKKWTM